MFLGHVAREARARGFIPVCPLAIERWPDVVCVLRARSVVVLAGHDDDHDDERHASRVARMLVRLTRAVASVAAVVFGVSARAAVAALTIGGRATPASRPQVGLGPTTSARAQLSRAAYDLPAFGRAEAREYDENRLPRAGIDTEGGADADGDPDTAGGTGTEAGTDTDAGTDTGAGADAGAGTDTLVGTETEAGTDTLVGTDTGADAGADTPVDTDDDASRIYPLRLRPGDRAIWRDALPRRPRSQRSTADTRMTSSDADRGRRSTSRILDPSISSPTDISSRQTGERQPDGRQTDERPADRWQIEAPQVGQRQTDRRQPDRQPSNEWPTDERQVDDRQADDALTDDRQADDRQTDDRQTDDQQIDDRQIDDRQIDGSARVSRAEARRRQIEVRQIDGRQVDGRQIGDSAAATAAPQLNDPTASAVRRDAHRPASRSSARGRPTAAEDADEDRVAIPVATTLRSGYGHAVDALVGRGRWAAAERALRAELAAHDRRQQTAASARTAVALGRLSLALGQIDRAERWLDHAGERASHAGDARLVGEVLRWSGTAALDRADLERSERLLRTALAAIGPAADPAQAVAIELALARCLSWQGRASEIVLPPLDEVSTVLPAPGVPYSTRFVATLGAMGSVGTNDTVGAIGTVGTPGMVGGVGTVGHLGTVETVGTDRTVPTFASLGAAGSVRADPAAGAVGRVGTIGTDGDADAHLHLDPIVRLERWRRTARFALIDGDLSRAGDALARACRIARGDAENDIRSGACRADAAPLRHLLRLSRPPTPGQRPTGGPIDVDADERACASRRADRTNEVRARRRNDLDRRGSGALDRGDGVLDPWDGVSDRGGGVLDRPSGAIDREDGAVDRGDGVEGSGRRRGGRRPDASRGRGQPVSLGLGRGGGPPSAVAQADLRAACHLDAARLQLAIGDWAACDRHLTTCQMFSRAPARTVRLQVMRLARLRGERRSEARRHVERLTAALRQPHVPRLVRLRARYLIEPRMRRSSELSAFLERYGEAALADGTETRGGSPMLEAFQAVLQICHETPDDLVALARVCAFLRDRLQAASVAVYGSPPHGPANAIITVAAGVGGSPASRDDPSLQGRRPPARESRESSQAGAMGRPPAASITAAPLRTLSTRGAGVDSPVRADPHTTRGTTSATGPRDRAATLTGGESSREIDRASTPTGGMSGREGDRAPSPTSGASGRDGFQGNRARGDTATASPAIGATTDAAVLRNAAPAAPAVPARLAIAGSVRLVSPELASRVLDSGLLIVPTWRADALDAAAPIRYGGQTVGALVARWIIDARLDEASAAALLSAAATAMAPHVRAALDRERASDASALPSSRSTLGLLGVSAAIDTLRQTIARVASAPFHVLIEGESGSGKELVARALHQHGPRRHRRFCAVNCAALTDELLEAELFGHTRGAFTGALTDRPGLFEEADGGTLFLDEIGELSARGQAKLLRAIQDGETRRIGENLPRRVDARIVAATNRSLRDEAAAGQFRADLLYRLDVIRIVVPPLRARPEDILVLARAFWQEALARTGGRGTLDPDTLAALARYHWPGNVRELHNAIMALAVHAPARGRVPRSLLPATITAAAARGRGRSATAAAPRATDDRGAYDRGAPAASRGGVRLERAPPGRVTAGETRDVIAPRAVPDGLSVDGPSPDGPSLDSVTVDGVTLDGVALDGVAPDGVPVDGVAVDNITLEGARRSFEQRFVRAALVRAGGHQERAARALGVTRQGLRKLMTRLGLNADGGCAGSATGD